jgi:hypothetical protein
MISLPLVNKNSVAEYYLPHSPAISLSSSISPFLSVPASDCSLSGGQVLLRGVYNVELQYNTHPFCFSVSRPGQERLRSGGGGGGGLTSHKKE